MRASVSTTLGGLPRVWRGPSMHCTATKAGPSPRRWLPGADAASVRAGQADRLGQFGAGGSARVGSRSHPATTATAALVFCGSTLPRAAMP